MPFVMLKKNWPGNFRRCVRDAAGKVLETLVFTPGQMVEIPLEQWYAIEKDIGPTLMLGELIDGRFVVRDPKDFILIGASAAPKITPDAVINIQTQPGEAFEDALLRKVLTEDPALQPAAEPPEPVPVTVTAPEPENLPEPEPLPEVAQTEPEPAAEQAPEEPAEEPAPRGRSKSAKALLNKE